MPLEIGTGTSFFTGRPIEEGGDGRRYKDYPEAIKEWLGYRETKGRRATGEVYTNYHVDPMKAYLLESSPIVSPYNTMAKRILDVAGEDGSPMYLLNLISGGRVYEKDLDRLMSAKEREENTALNELLIDYGIAQPRSGVYVNPSIDMNQPQLLELLKELGYNYKPKTDEDRQKAQKKAEEKQATLQELLGTL
jgi:hypothetical protein